MKSKILVVKDMEQLCINSDDDLSSGSPVIDDRGPAAARAR